MGFELKVSFEINNDRYTLLLTQKMARKCVRYRYTQFLQSITYVDVQIVLDFIQKLIGLENRDTFASDFEVHCTYSAFELDIVLGR